MSYTVKGAEPATNETLAEIEKKTGPNNSFRTMALHPTAMADFARFYETTMGPGAVDRRLKELAYLAASFVNECEYCSKHHEISGGKAGISPQEIHNISKENDQDFTPLERIVMRYSRELTRTCAVDDTTRTTLQHDFSPEQQVEITLVIALANFTNRFNNGLNVGLEK